MNPTFLQIYYRSWKKDDTPIDILNRQEIVARLMELLTTLSNTKGSCTFALNGRWGAGKTFVLKMVERQLRDYQAGEKFAVFHYNCWEYDYYDELLIAIVSSMLDSIRTLYNKNGLPYIGVDEYMKHRL